MRRPTRWPNAFEAAFWCEDIGTYALALDGEKRPCRVRTSNAGQVLFTGIAPPERAEAVARDLMRPAFFSGWGIRTVATRGAPLQSDVLSQWIGLAARQRADRARASRATGTKPRSSASSRACSTPRATWICAACRNCSAASSGGAAAGRRSIRSPARRRPGPPPRRSRCCRRRSASSSIRRKRDPAAQSAPAGVPRRGDAPQSAPRRFERRSRTASP